MDNQRKGLLYGALLGDSFALAPHWIYDTSVIEQNFSQSDSLEEPTFTSYHKGKKKGDFTHYGDQAAHLAHFINDSGGFDIESYKSSWLNFVKVHPMYIDHATKESMTLLDESDALTGSHSDDLGGIVSNCAFYLLEKVDEAAMVQRICMTHDNEEVLAVWAFISKVIDKVLQGLKPSDAIEDVMKSSTSKQIRKGYDDAHAQMDNQAVTAIAALGQSCSSKFGLPSSLYLIMKYEDNYRAAMKANILAGGDSAARGMVVGMVLGAYCGYEALPKDWLEDLNFSL